MRKKPVQSTIQSGGTLIRDELESQVESLLIGPLNDEQEEILESAPTDTYVTGILWPNDIFLTAEDEQDADSADGDGNSDGDHADIGAPLHSVLRPSSIGMTFSVEGEQSDITLTITGARYIRTSTGTEGDSRIAGSGTLWRWHRKPVTLVHVVESKRKSGLFSIEEFSDCDGNRVEGHALRLVVKKRFLSGNTVFTVSLVNTAPADGSPGEVCFFQSQISATAGRGGRIVPRPPAFRSGEEDNETNDLIYRHAVEYASGHGIAAEWNPQESGNMKTVYTSWMPKSVVSAVSADGHSSMSALSGREDSPLRAQFLSTEARRAEVIESLRQFSRLYAAWITERETEIAGLPKSVRKTGRRHMDSCQKAMERISNGIEFLEKDNDAWTAFRLANKIMNEQAQGPLKEKRAAPLVWRPFQIAFILMALRSAACPKDDFRDTMDLLWFPTGGGKTEAYLGLTAFTIFYTRISCEKDRSEPRINVLMRYTLRLLTMQQFQRAAEMICQSEVLRRNDTALLGTVPISLGLWVGSDSTPNRLFGEDRSAEAALKSEMEGGTPRSSPRVLRKCPLCATPLRPADYKLDPVNQTLELFCGNSACTSAGAPLPVYTVDEQIYEKSPSLLLATVDKFAQLPRNGHTGKLFGKPSGSPPSLIIQDELHLISGPLGSICGLYESLIDLLCTVDGAKPKVVGSTATIGRAKQQVNGLFDREVMQFPPPALTSDDSFFAVKAEDIPGRLYVGICSSGRSPKFTLQALSAACLQAIAALFDQKASVDEVEQEIDPYWTLALYFNALRELGGAKVMVSDDIPRSMQFFANRLGARKRNLNEPKELTGRMSSVEIPFMLDQLSVGLNADPFDEGEALDVILASSMISVGMDIPRLGLMVVSGQPKTTAEYIQATSRVGRTKPGLVYTVYNASRPRDLSHFEHYSGYHAALYRSVEATSVTPWSARACDKALRAVLVAAVRHLVPDMSADEDAINFLGEMPGVEKILEFLTMRATNTEFPVEREQFLTRLQDFVRDWSERAKRMRSEGQEFEYFARYLPYKRKAAKPHLLKSAEEIYSDNELAWRMPNSMRDVEPSTQFTIWK